MRNLYLILLVSVLSACGKKNLDSADNSPNKKTFIPKSSSTPAPLPPEPEISQPEISEPETPPTEPVDIKPKPPENQALVIDTKLPPKLQSLHEALLAKPEAGYGNLKKFQSWAKLGQWEEFGPTNHYDWWMFPIKAFPGATSTTKEWAVSDAEVALLKESPLFMKDYREAVRLMALSWAYDIDAALFIDNRGPGQKWNGYIIRMDKLGQSLKLFGETKRFNSLVNFRNYFKIDRNQTHWGL